MSTPARWTNAPRETLAGRARTPIPEPMQAWLTESYRLGQLCHLPVPVEDQPEFLRLSRIFAARRGLTIQYRTYETDEGEAMLAFRMKDKRPYRRAGA